MLKRYLLPLPLAILMVSSHARSAIYRGPGQATGLLDNKVGKIHIEEYAARDILHKISREAHIPIGFQSVEQPAKGGGSSVIELLGGTVREVLDAFVSQFPGYQWSEDDGVVHIIWHGTHLPIADIAIFYPGVEDVTLGEIWGHFGEIPELKAWLAANNCSYPAFVIGSELYTPPGVKKQIPRFSIDGGPITLAQLLDQIAIKSGENFWAIVQTFPEESCVVDIYMLREHWPVTN